jgi:diguanylate cyclase (GGDEF)-like protein
MQMNLRNTDIIGRLGGEEFLIMLPETDIQTSLEIIERLRENVAAFRLDYASKQIAFTVSLGLVEVSAKDENIETLITNADNALYQAKSQGRNRSEVFQANPPPSNPAS